MLNGVTSNRTTPIQKQTVQNPMKSGNDFSQALSKQINATQTPPLNSSDVRFSADGSFILDKNAIQVIKPKEERSVTTQEVQNELGVSQAEAEKILNEFKLVVPVDYRPKEGEVSIKDLVDGSRTLKEMKIREADHQKVTYIDVSANTTVTDSSKVDFTNMTPNEFAELTKSGRFPELPPIVLPKGLDLTKDSKPQMEASLDTKVNYIDMIQKQIEFNKSIGESTTYLDNFLNLMKNFNA